MSYNPELIITGVPHSGTSLIAKVINEKHPLSGELTGMDFEYPMYECASVMRIDTIIMKSLKIKSPKPHWLTYFDNPEQVYDTAVADIELPPIRRFKDPFVCFTLPLWNPKKIVWCRRPMRDVVKSLMVRDKLTKNEATKLYLTYDYHLRYHLNDLKIPYIMARFNKFKAKDKKHIKKVLEFIAK